MPDYNPTEEVRLLQYNNASNEVLVDVTQYPLDGDADKYIEMEYSTYLNLEPVIRNRDGCGDFGNGGCQAPLNKNSVLLTIEEWKTLISLKSYLANQFFHDSIEIQHILEHTEGLSSPMTRTILELMQSLKLKEFYNNLVRCVIVQKSKRGEIRRMAAAAAVGDVNVILDENVCDVCEIVEQTLNYRCNINSHNVLCIMEAYRHRPGCTINGIMSHR
ncbi:hypothetical protein FQA39_LY05057 [Lamprigera yunnana]|nr:hypothetical protein FQA39_LY05057 [Lamprigera yunnana]